MVKFCYVICFMGLALVMVNNCFAQMVCGNTIISGGDNMEKVFRECGSPTMTSSDMDGGRKGKGPNTYYYDMGDGSYVKKLFVQGGRIESIESLEKGE